MLSLWVPFSIQYGNFISLHFSLLIYKLHHYHLLLLHTLSFLSSHQSKFIDSKRDHLTTIFINWWVVELHLSIDRRINKYKQKILATTTCNSISFPTKSKTHPPLHTHTHTIDNNCRDEIDQWNSHPVKRDNKFDLLRGRQIIHFQFPLHF